MQLINLEDRMVVRQRSGDYKIVMGECLAGLKHYLSLSSLDNNMKCKSNRMSSSDIMAVYKTDYHSTITDYLAGNGLFLLWERQEKTPRQLELDDLNGRMSGLIQEYKKLDSFSAAVKLLNDSVS
jgi:hypothetical protein